MYFMNVILLHSNHRHTSATRVVIFTVVRGLFYHLTGILTKNMCLLNAFHSVVLDKTYLCNTVKHNYFIKTWLQEVFK